MEENNIQEKTVQLAIRLTETQRQEFHQYGGNAQVVRNFVDMFIANRKKELGVK